MINIKVNQTEINPSNLGTLVVGNVDSIKIEFAFSDEWQNLYRSAVFTNGSTCRKISLLSSTCSIPWEVLTEPGELFVSLRGVGNDGNFVLCTADKSLGKVEPSHANDDASEPETHTPDEFEEIQSMIAEILLAGGIAGEDGKSAYEIAVEHGFTGTELQWLTSLKGADGADGIDGTDGIDGVDGKSAYQLARDHGFSGTEVQWLASLKGADGTNGRDGRNGADGVDGADGKSAYQLARDHGFSGTEVQWLASLKGADGTNGTDGRNGTDGLDGSDGYTPVRGTDYWTSSDIQSTISDVLEALPVYAGEVV